MADTLSSAASTAGQAAKSYAVTEGGKAISGAVATQAKKIAQDSDLANVTSMTAGDVAGQATKAATSAVKGSASDVTKRMTEAGEGVVAVGEKAMDKGMTMMENVLDAAELAKLMEDLGEFVEKHPKLAVLGIPKLVLGVPGLLLFAFLTVVIFIVSLVLALVLALIVAVLFLVIFVLITLLVIFPLFLSIFFVALFGCLWGLLFYFMVVRKVKKKYGHLVPDVEKFRLPSAPTHEPVFKRGTKHKLPAKKRPTQQNSEEPIQKQENAAFTKGTKSKLPTKKKSSPPNSEGPKLPHDFPDVPQHDPGASAKSNGSERDVKSKAKKRPLKKKQPIRAE